MKTSGHDYSSHCKEPNFKMPKNFTDLDFETFVCIGLDLANLKFAKLVTAGDDLDAHDGLSSMTLRSW